MRCGRGCGGRPLAAWLMSPWSGLNAGSEASFTVFSVTTIVAGVLGAVGGFFLVLRTQRIYNRARGHADNVGVKRAGSMSSRLQRIWEPPSFSRLTAPFPYCSISHDFPRLSVLWRPCN
jgi:hypothetical protein